ncbi:MAG TPA: HEPN domain-containing protein [Gaiellaceae bacterium]|nr:MAG: hypothetical protein A2Y55_05795 [Actinobacteria bacterium RBG_16_68_12]
MSPRSEEFMAEARGRLAAAKTTLDSGFLAAAVSLGYYAMLYAARAALSEEDRYAKTHSGTWQLFRETFVSTQRFGDELLAQAERTLPLRLGVDYDARPVERKEAEAVVDLAARFLQAIDDLYPD